MNIAEGLSMIENLVDVSASTHCEMALLQATAVALTHEADIANLFTDDTRQHLRHPTHPVSALLARLGHWRRRDITAFGNLSRPVIGTSSRRRDAMINILHLSMESAVEAEQLRLSSASRLAREALALSSRTFGENCPVSRFAASLEARLLYEQDRVDDADRLVRDRLGLIVAQGCVESALASYALGARIAVTRGQTAYAVLLLREAEELGRRRGWMRLVAASLADRVRILLDAERHSDAKDCLSRLVALASKNGTSENDKHINRQVVLARARATLHFGPTEATAENLRRMISSCADDGDCRMLVEAQGLLACVLLMLGHTTQSHSEAIQCLRVGAAAGLFRTFLDEGAAMRGLLLSLDSTPASDAAELSALRPYLRSLLSTYAERVEQTTSARCRHRSGETLSARERHIITLISHGMSNKRIAKELGIAPETVKSHAKHILLKLAAQTRVEAVSLAMRLGIL